MIPIGGGGFFIDVPVFLWERQAKLSSSVVKEPPPFESVYAGKEQGWRKTVNVSSLVEHVSIRE